MTILELAHQTGIKPKWVASTHGGEFHSPCPECGGTDRFFIQPYRQMSSCTGWYRCRQCGIAGDAIKFARQFLNYTFQEAAQAVNATISPSTTHFLFNRFHTPTPTTLQPPSSLWIVQASALTEYAHKQIFDNKEILNYLLKRGLGPEAILKYKLGWLNHNKSFSRASWGLNNSSNSNSLLWISRGLLIPTIERDATIRLKSRRADWKIGDKKSKYQAISGSMNGLSIIGSTNSDVVIVVESELDAYAAHNAVADFACIIAVGSNIKNPDNVSDRLAKRASHLLICHDNDTAGIKMFDKWHKLYPHAKASPTPVGKDIGEAIILGMDIREWLKKKIS